MVEEKQWYKSKTIWGALLAVAASFMGLLGIDLDETAQLNIAETLVQLGGVIGSMVAIYGRLGATEVIT